MCLRKETISRTTKGQLSYLKSQAAALSTKLLLLLTLIKSHTMAKATQISLCDFDFELNFLNSFYSKLLITLNLKPLMGRKRNPWKRKPTNFKKFTDFMSNFDAFGQTSDWNIDGAHEYKTAYGSILTLATLTLCSFYGYWLFRDLFNNKGNRLAVSPTVHHLFPADDRYSLGQKNGFQFAVGLSSLTGFADQDWEDFKNTGNFMC
jgi:hypothetical protein